jgi:hypothetical protein
VAPITRRCLRYGEGDFRGATGSWKSSASDRISVHAGDFFEDALPPADLYALGRILHDWTEPKIRLLLQRIAEALPSGGGLLLAEKILNEDKCGPVHVQMQSLNMLVCTEGKERTLSDTRRCSEKRVLLMFVAFGRAKRWTRFWRGRHNRQWRQQLQKRNGAAGPIAIGLRMVRWS